MVGHWAVIVHGGCKPVAPQEEPANRVGIAAAVSAAARLLAAGASSLDAVEAAVRALEDDSCFNAGTGAVAKADGVVELDASIMEGGDLKVGAVCALQGVRNPVSVARALLDEEETLLAGEGARKFAQAQGFRMETLAPRQDAAAGCDTVGCVAIDQNGRIAVATSTGGLNGALPGRVGDAPLPGCGFYADDTLGGVSLTGEGERIMRVMLAGRVMEALRTGPDAQAAADLGLQALDRIGGEAGVIAVDRSGHIGWSHNAAQMAVGWMRAADSEPHAQVAGVASHQSGSRLR
jgi:beta-aspartyl-peptidase (threonine type)